MKVIHHSGTDKVLNIDERFEIFYFAIKTYTKKKLSIQNSLNVIVFGFYSKNHSILINRIRIAKNF